ncbi:MAG: alpha/beta fold hydrolase [Pseudomonadota bacterium]
MLLDLLLRAAVVTATIAAAIASAITSSTTPVTAAEAVRPSGIAFSEIEALEQPEPDHRLTYGSHPSQFIELWLPRDISEPPPIVVLIHGGCWLSAFGVDHIRPLAAALAGAGYAVWAPEYRRVGEPGGGDPGTLEDISTMLAALSTLSPVALNTSRIALAGHSAGGHLALWAAAQQNTPAGSHQIRPALKGVVGLAAITDLPSYAVLPGSCAPGTAQFMGGPPEQLAERYRELSPSKMDFPVPVVLIQGENDAIVPLAQARALPEARLHLIEDAGHFDLIYPPSPAFNVLLKALEHILDV